MNNFDVIVAGAGPAGLLAAGRAAELGGKVQLVEKMGQEVRTWPGTLHNACLSVTADGTIKYP